MRRSMEATPAAKWTPSKPRTKAEPSESHPVELAKATVGHLGFRPALKASASSWSMRARAPSM